MPGLGPIIATTNECALDPHRRSRSHPRLFGQRWLESTFLKATPLPSKARSASAHNGHLAYRRKQHRLRRSHSQHLPWRARDTTREQMGNCLVLGLARQDLPVLNDDGPKPLSVCARRMRIRDAARGIVRSAIGERHEGAAEETVADPCADLKHRHVYGHGKQINTDSQKEKSH